jgi:Sugar (and other) transporter
MIKSLKGSGTFWTFSAGALLSLVSVYLFVPETRGQTLEEITPLLDFASLFAGAV